MVAASLERGTGIIQVALAHAEAKLMYEGHPRCAHSLSCIQTSRDVVTEVREIGRFRDRPKLPGHLCAMIWHAQSCCGRLGGTAKGNVKPTDAGKSQATTQLEHVEVCHGGVFACSKGAMDASRSKSCREPFRGEMSEIWGQTWSQRAWKGVLTSYGWP